MKVTQIVVTYENGSKLILRDWEQLDMTNAANISTIEETTLMSLSEVRSRYRFVTQPNTSSYGHEPKGMQHFKCEHDSVDLNCPYCHPRGTGLTFTMF